MPSLTVEEQASLQVELKKLTLLKGLKHGSGATSAAITVAEKQLHVIFPPALRQFLKTVGWVSAPGNFNLLGLGKDTPQKLNAVTMTIGWRNHRKNGIPLHVIALSGDPAINAAVLDTNDGSVTCHDFNEDPDDDLAVFDPLMQWDTYIAWLRWECVTALEVQGGIVSE